MQATLLDADTHDQQTRLLKLLSRSMLGGTKRVLRKSRMADMSDSEAELERVRTRLTNLDAERQQLQFEMVALEARLAATRKPAVKRLSSENTPVTNTSLSHEKIKLFQSLFAGRPDVFPMRWENRKTRQHTHKILIKHMIL